MSVLRSSIARPAVRKAAKRRLWLMLAGLLVAALVIAWIDGGERALRPISETVELPTVSRSAVQ